MTNLSPAEVAELTSNANAGDLSACDTLATHFYNEHRYEESAALYLKALRGNFYGGNSKPDSEHNFFGMIDRGLIPHTSEATRFVRERRRVIDDVTARANKAAGSAGIAVFIGYLLLVFGGGITGMLRDFSLLIAGGLAWLVWKLVLN